MSRLHASRRELIATLSASGAATFLPWLRPRSAHAASIPTRLLLFWSGSGVPRQTYNFQAAGGGPATETDFVFSDVRAPLNAIRKDLIAFENLDMLSANVDPSQGSNAHFAAETHCLAATNRANGETAGGPSIDQYIAKAINSPAPVTRVPSLALASQVDGNVSYIKPCTAAAGQVVALQPSAAATYKRLFTGFTPPAMGKPAPTGPSDESLQQKSVIDLVLGDFEAAKGRLGKAERIKLEAHAAVVRDVERRLALGGATGSMPGVSCQDPTMAVLKGAANNTPDGVAAYKAIFDANARMIQSAFACDLTRVVLLCMGEIPASLWGYNSGMYGTSDAHDLIHKTSYNSAGILKGNPEAMKTIGTLHQQECTQFAAIVDLLRQIPEADGKTMLDHTLVLWCSQISEHGHDTSQLPWVLAGGSAVGFKPGRLLRYPRVGGKGAPHNNLFVSLAQAMGVQTNTFGNPAVCTGPLDRLRI